MDLQVLFNNPINGSNKEKGMAKRKSPLKAKKGAVIRKGKRNPVTVYTKTEEVEVPAKSGKGREKVLALRDVVAGKINVRNKDDMKKLGEIKKRVERSIGLLADAKQRAKHKAKLESDWKKILKQNETNKNKMADEQVRYAKKGYSAQWYDTNEEAKAGNILKVKDVSRLRKKLAGDKSKEEKKAKELVRKIGKELSSLKKDGATSTRKKKKEAPKKAKKKTTRKTKKAKTIVVKAKKVVVKKAAPKKTAKKATRKASKKRVTRAKTRRNPYVELNPKVTTANKTAKKTTAKKKSVAKKATAKKSTVKKTTAKKSSKKTSAKKSVAKKSAVGLLAEVAPKKTLTKKRKTVKKKKIVATKKKAVKTSSKKVATKKKVTKKNVKRGKNPSGDSMAKANKFVHNIETGLGRSLKEFGYLLGGAGIDQVAKASVKLLPAQVFTYAAKIGVTPKMLQLLVPATLGVAANIIGEKQKNNVLKELGHNMVAATAIRGTIEAADLVAKKFPTVPLLKDMTMGAIAPVSDFGSIQRVTDFSGVVPAGDFAGVVAEGDFAGIVSGDDFNADESFEFDTEDLY